MEFVGQNIGKLLLKKLEKTREAKVAVAYFTPDADTLDALAACGQLDMVISEEFAINNPYKLEKLARAKLLAIAPESEYGKFHGKVFVLKLDDNSSWVLLGSANLTHAGMFSNQEACITLDSSDSGDDVVISRIMTWFDLLSQRAGPIDIAQAKSIFDNRSRLMLVQRPTAFPPQNSNFWALKTTSGTFGRSRWPMFEAEG